jgi:uncharacterized protein YndB with AHSA1/START domain
MEGAFDLKISRVLNVPRALVWKAWTTKEHIEKWWCPKPWQAEFTAFEIRPGGAFNAKMHGPEGEEQVIPGSILLVEPMEKIVFTEMLAADWRPIAEPFLGMTAIITFQDAPEGTRYSALVRHKSAEDAKRHDEMGFSDGWATAIAQLEEVAKTLA